MELALTIVAVVGILIFVIAYLRFVISGFKHHPVTGIISIFPVVNLLVVPSLWYRNGRFLILGFISLLLAVGAWYMGGEKGVNKYIGSLFGKSTSVIESSQINTPSKINSSQSSLSVDNSVGNIASNSADNKKALNNVPMSQSKQSNTATTHEKPASVKATLIDESNLLIMPMKALYKMGFEEMPVKDIATLQGRIVRITDKNLEIIEGRIVHISPSSVFLQKAGMQQSTEYSIANIKKLSLMLKKNIK